MRHAARLLRRDPLITLVAVLSLAIGIGATTTIFTIGHALLFRAPAGVADPEAVIDVGTSTPGGGFGNSSYPNYVDLRLRATSLSGLYASSMFPHAMSLSGAGDSQGSERVFATTVTANYFSVLGATPAAGRLFDPARDDRSGAVPVVVLSHRFWRRRFREDPHVVGRTVMLNRQGFTVIGVAAEEFQGTTIRAGDLWVPMAASGTVPLGSRGAAVLQIGGRLKPEVSIAEAGAELETIGRALEHEYPDENKGRTFLVEASSPVPGATTPVAVFLFLLLAIVIVVLAIACANLAGLLLARGAARRTEIAVRLAIGAGRARLVRQLLAETLLLFLFGGLSGLAIARGLTSALVSLLPALPFPIEVSLALDVRALLFTGVVAILSALLSGLAPALQATKADVMSALKDDAAAPARLRLRHAFVVAQVAFSVLLVIVAGLFVRALQAAGSGDHGFDPHGVELASVDLAQAGYTDATGPRFAIELTERVRALPGVQTASAALTLPGGFETQRRSLTVPGVAPPGGGRFFGMDWNVVETGYFAALRIPIVSGRDFTDGDRAGTQGVAIVGEGAARQFWNGSDPIGKYITPVSMGPNRQIKEAKPLQVVGIARDVRASSLIDGLSRSIVYVPLRQQYTPAFTIVARTTQGQRAAEEIRGVIAAMDPALPVVGSQTLEDVTALGLAPQRVVVFVAGSLGLIGALLAAIGIYGVSAYTVASRRREIGIRMALGAARADVLGLVLRRGVALTVAGAGVGLLLAAGASRVLGVFLFGLSALDPVIFGSAAVFFSLVGSTACYIPARRAAAIDPLSALRYE